MLTILDNGLRFTDTLQYAWFHLQKDGQTWYRVVALKELAVIPVAVREDYDLMSKTWASLRGLHDAGVNFVFAAAGLYKPSHVGIIQYFGAAAQADGEQAAAVKAMRDVKAIEANLAGGFSQAKLGPPNLDWFRWYLDFVTSRAEYISVILGHPDPRSGNRGFAGSDGKIGDPSNDDLANEQNEILFRGLSRLRENFVFQVLAERRERTRMHDAVLKIAEAASNVASRRKGAISIGMSLGIPIITSLGQSTAGGESHGQGTSQSRAEGTSEGWSDSYQKNESQSTSVSHSRSVSNSVGGSEGTSHTDSQSQTTSRSESNGTNWSQSSGSSTSRMTGGSSSWNQSNSVSQNWNQGNSVSSSASVSTGETNSVSETAGTSTGESVGQSTTNTISGGLSAGGSGNVGGSLGVPGTGVHAGVGGSVGANAGLAHSQGTSETQSTGASESTTAGQSSTTTQSVGSGVSTSSSQGGGTGQTSGVGGSSTWGQSVSSMSSSSKGGSHTVTDGTATSTGTAQGKSTSHTWGRSEGETWTTTHGRSTGQGWGQTATTGRSYAEGTSDSVASARTLASGITGGFSTGLIPSLSINRSWQTEDDVAERLTDILRSLEGIANQASAEGGFMTNVWLFTETDAGQVAAQALVPQAFHGPAVPTPVMSVNPNELDIDLLRAHAISFVPWTENGQDVFTNGDLWTEYATLLNCQQLAAYVAPGLFEEGSASTVMAPIPQGIGFYPDLPGDAVLGHQYSPETADLTPAQVRVSFGNLMHTAFIGDTGFGKSVAAIRMAYETTLHWKMRTVVLDFGAGWRALLNAPGLEGHVDILQLWPDAVRPMRWNPLQIGRHISPETQWRAFADVFGAVAQLGVKRQKQEMLDALRKLYLDNGVLIDDPQVRSHARWGLAQVGDEANLAACSAGTPIATLPAPARQKLAVYRSSLVGLANLYDVVADKLKAVPARDTMLSGVLDGILFRMNPLVQGAASMQFAPGPDCIPVEDFSKPWGITIIEGGMFLDEFGKAFLLGWTGWHLYMDMVSRRVHEVNTGEPLLQIFYEEANKIFVQDSGGEDGGGMSASQRFSDMFRDARKYLARLHVVSQAPSLIAQDIMSSCNNLVAGFIKNPRDKDLVLSALARSEKGFRDEEWRRFVDDIPIGMAIGRFPYTTRRELQRPMLFRPLMLDVPEPTDAEILAMLGPLGVRA
jgi:hypothetical protein